MAISWKDWATACSIALAAGVTLGAAHAGMTGSGSPPRPASVSRVDATTLPPAEDHVGVAPGRAAQPGTTARTQATVSTPGRSVASTARTLARPVEAGGPNPGKSKRHGGKHND